MTPSIADLIADSTAVAMTFRRTLEPVEGRDVPVFPRPMLERRRPKRLPVAQIPFGNDFGRGALRLASIRLFATVPI